MLFSTGGQVQTSVNGLTIQNGLTTNLVNAKAATGEEVPEQVNSNINMYILARKILIFKSNLMTKNYLKM